MARVPGRTSDSSGPGALAGGVRVAAGTRAGPLAGSQHGRAPNGEEEVTGQRIVPPPSPAGSESGRAATQSDVFAVRGVRGPLVGRARELTEMAEAVARAVDFHAPQLITVVGNQGTGKSRLIAELLERHVSPPMRVFSGRADAGSARYSVIEKLLRDRFSIAEGDEEEQWVGRFTGQVEHVFGDERVAEVLHFLGQFLGLHFPDSPFLRVLGESPQQHDEIARTVLRRFIEVDAQESPLVLVFDDLQWADEESLQVLRELGAGLGGTPVVLIAAARPELLVRFSEWGSGTTDHLRIDLRNLEPDDAAVMLDNLLSRCDDVSEEIVDDAVEMTGGNPHFMEQLVRLFLDNGTIDSSREPWRLDPERASATQLPISIEEAIEARIAALGGEERDILEKGAVFGNVFWVGAAVALTRLEAAGDPGHGAEELDWTDAGEPVRARVIEVVDDLVDRDYL
ncbi:MAG TPA: AAA family ATPase, partial [Candidatus Acidoferrum sp.]|nr:AAA family ATPase [Candidatus Acidoferrum sp.]